MFVLLKDVYVWGAPQGSPIGGEGCRHRPSEAQGECLAPAGAFLDRDDHPLQHLLVRLWKGWVG